MLRLAAALASLSLLLASACIEGDDVRLGAITLVLGGENALSADGETLLPVFVQSVDGQKRAHPGRLLVTTTLGDLLDPTVDDLVGPSITIRGDGAVFFVRCPVGVEGDAHVVVQRRDGVSAELFAFCSPPLVPRLEIDVSGCGGFESYEGGECPLRARVTLEGPSTSVPARAAPVTFRLSDAAAADDAPLAAALVIPGGFPTNEVTLRADGGGFVEVTMLPPTLFAPYEVAVSVWAVTSAGFVSSEVSRIEFPFADLSALALTAEETSLASTEVTALGVIAKRYDGAPAAGAAISLALDEEGAAAGALLVNGDESATTLTLFLDDDGTSAAAFRAPPTADLLQIVVQARMALTHGAPDLLDHVVVTVNPRTLMEVSVSESTIENQDAATITATVARTGEVPEPVVGESVSFALDVTSADLARLDGGAATVIKASDGDGRASVVLTAAGPDVAGAAVVRVTAGMDGLPFEDLVVIDITDGP